MGAWWVHVGVHGGVHDGVHGGVHGGCMVGACWSAWRGAYWGIPSSETPKKPSNTYITHITHWKEFDSVG